MESDRQVKRLVYYESCEHGSMTPHPTIEGIKSDAINLKAGGAGILSGVPTGMSYKNDCPGGTARYATEEDVRDWLEWHESLSDRT